MKNVNRHINNVNYWQADILSAYDYSPFGVMLTGRTFEKIDSVPVTTTEIVPIAKDSVMVSVEDYIHYTDFEEAVHTTSSALPVTYTNYHGWTNWSNSTLSTEYRSGSNWLKINSTVGSGGANKYLLLQPSTQYRLTFTADRASVANFVVVAATISSTNSLNIFATKTVSTNGAQTFTFTTPASLPMNVVMLQLRQVGIYYIDNFAVSVASSSLVLDNGDFESGAYASNTVMDYYDDWYNRANLPIAIAQGNWMNRIRVNYGDPYDCLRKVISVTPNQQYTFRGKIVGAQNGNVRVMQKNTGTSTLYLVTYQLISTNDGYVEFNFTPTMNEVQITVNAPGTYYLEDVAVFKTITQKKYTPTTHEKVLPTFTNVQNMTQTGATVQSTSGSGSKGGESVQQINKGDYVQFEIGSDALSNYYYTSVGISYTPSGKNIEMDFSWYLALPAMTRDVLVAGVYKPNLNNPRLFQNGDVYRIWRNNGNVEFYVNGLLDGTFPDKYPDRPMYLEAVFYDVNKKVENLYIYKEVLKTHDTIQTTEMVAKVDGYKYGFNSMEKDNEIKGSGNSYDFGARMYDTRLGRWLTIDALAGKYPSLSPYNFVANSPIIYIDPDGQRIKPMSKEAFDILLSSLPPEVRKHVKMDKNGFVKIKSAESLIQKTNSGNVKALCAIVSDERIVELYTDEKKYDYIDSKTGKTKTNEFSKPELANDFKDELDAFVGSDEEKEEYAKNLKNNGVVLDEDYYNGNFGATIRPESMQEPYPGGQISPSENIRVYINPVGLSGEQKAKNIGHELFSHVYFYLTKKDPRHGGESGAPDGNPALNAQIKERESESSENFNKK